MTNDDMLYQSWISKGSYFNRMIDCGDFYNQWVQNALEYLPVDILDQYKERLVFIAMGHRDGCRLSRALCENREIVVLSERVLPKENMDEGQSDVRYFIYVVLHEVVHAIKRHRSPLYDSLTPEEMATQESEADNLALEWFNNHILTRNNPNLLPITREEIDEAKERSRTVMERQYKGA